jgi:pimeloyl-ACP methyl ester carboxylesterase
MPKLEHTLSFRDPAGRQIAGILATPPCKSDRLVVLCHGFLSNKNSATNKALTEMLVAKEIATLRFDFFGHAESEGVFHAITVGTAAQQAVAALQVAQAQGYQKVGLVGSSFGGLAAVLAGAEFCPLACLALKCPVSDFSEMLREEFGDSGIREWQATNTIPNVTGGAGRIRLAYSFYEDCSRQIAYAAAKMVTSPTLIVHGDADERVPLSQSLRLRDSLGGQSSLVVIPGADHHFSQPAHFREMIAHIGQWLVTHLRSSPSS